MDVPAENEGGVAAKSEGADEGVWVRTTPEFDQWELN